MKQQADRLSSFLKTHRLKRRYRIGLIALVIILVLAGGGFAIHHAGQAQAAQRQAQARDAKIAAAKKKKPAPAKKKAQVQAINWRKPSQNKPYPKVADANSIVMHVNVEKQRIYIEQQGHVVYTMYASTGKNNATPRGTFHILSRGAHFYSPDEKMGANYWTAFSGNSFLFHSVPVDAKGHYIKSEAANLGIRPSSHGCVRLSVADAKWINQNVPTGTKVIIA